MASSLYYGGIEGGASHSKFTLMGSDGKVLANSSGENTNHYLIGMEECLQRIHAMIQEGLAKADLPEDTTLDGIGMSLSGGDEISSQEAFKKLIKEKYPTMAKHIFIGSDTQSAVATALPKGGVVLIAGTGSNCQLINEDGSMARSGGWGHMVGDESSACWIVLKAVKSVFDHDDEVIPSKHSVEIIRKVIYDYFKIQERSGLLDHLYKDFNKTKFAGCCKSLAEEALKTKDALACSLFYEAGRYLAKHLCAVAVKMSESLKERKGGVPIVCVGSVFKSWELLQPGFAEEMKLREKETGIKEVTLLRLNVDASVGATSLGAMAAGKELPIDYTCTATAFYNGSFSANEA